MSTLSSGLQRLRRALETLEHGERLVRVGVPVATVSEANAHTHWRRRQGRAKYQREAIGLYLRSRFGRMLHHHLANGGLVVRLVRVAPRELDSDNLAGALKHVRDGVAAVLQVDDRDPRVTWVVDQQKGPAGVVVEVWRWP